MLTLVSGGCSLPCPGGVNGRSPTSIVVTHCECDSADADLFSTVLKYRPRFGAPFGRDVMSRKLAIIIKDTHRGLWYEDGILTKVLEAGRYEIPNNEGFFGA